MPDPALRLETAAAGRLFSLAATKTSPLQKVLARCKMSGTKDADNPVRTL